MVYSSGETQFLSHPFPSPFTPRAGLFFSFTSGSGLYSQEPGSSPGCPLQTVPHQCPERLPSGSLHFLLTQLAPWSCTVLGNWQFPTDSRVRAALATRAESQKEEVPNGGGRGLRGR